MKSIREVLCKHNFQKIDTVPIGQYGLNHWVIYQCIKCKKTYKKAEQLLYFKLMDELLDHVIKCEYEGLEK